MTSTGGSGGPLTDRTSVSYNNGVKTSTYHIYAAGLDWSKQVGLLVYGDGSGEFGLANPTDTYLLAGTNGLIAVAKSHNMILVTPRAPGNGCTDGDGVCWYLGSNDGTTRAQKTKWLDDLIKTQVLPLYDIEKTRVCIAGFSSGAENTAGIYGPAYAASWMEDGLLLAISYGSSPDQYGITDTYTASFRANVAVVWDVRGGDETTAVADSLEGYNWYTAEGFSALERNVIPGGAHDRPGEFGGIVDTYVAEHVTAAMPIGGAVAATFRAATDDARGTTTDAQPALPVGTVAGDLLIAIQVSDLNGSLAAMTAPAGWTPVGSGSRVDAGFMKVWTKTATGSEPATYTFVDSTSAYGSTIVIAVTGHDPANPLIVAPTFANGAASTSHVAPSVTGAANALLITAALAGTAGTTRDYSAPAGMTTAQESTVTTGGMILLGAWYEALASGSATGTRTATCTASTPWVAVSLVVGAPVPQTVTPTGIASGQTFGAATVTVAAAPAQTVTAVGIASGQAFGIPIVGSAGVGSSGGLYPSETLYPSESLYPSDGGVPSDQTVGAIGFDAAGAIGIPTVDVGLTPEQTVTAVGIASLEAFGNPILSLAAGPLTVGPTPVDTGEAFGVPAVSVAVASQTVFALGFDDGTEFGRPTVTVSFTPPVQSGPTYHDTYYLDGIDLSSLVSQIEVAEGLQDLMGTVGDNVVLPGLDGELSVFGEPGQPRRTDGPGRLTLNMWMFGVDPNTGEVTSGDHPAEDWFREWDKVVRRFRRRRLTIDHPRPDGTRRAVAHYAVGESMEPTDRSAGSPWFGRYKAVLTIPAAHWTDIDSVTASASLPNNGVLSLGAFAAATAPCTELVVTFGPGNNPRLSTSYNHIGYNGTIAPGQQLTIDTATGLLGTGSGSAWAPNYANLTLAPGPRLFEIDPSENLSAVLTHTGGGSMSVEVTGKRRYRTS